MKLAVKMTKIDRDAYNALTSVESAHQELRRRHRFSAFLSDFAGLAAEHSLTNQVGAFLLHRHFQLAAEEIMLERFDSTDSDEPAYVSTACTPRDEADAVPSRWYLSKAGDFRALEYSQDPGVANAFERVSKETAFLDRYAGILAEHGLTNCIGLSSTDRALIPWTPGHSYREESGDGVSVVQLVESPSVVTGTGILETTWMPISVMGCRVKMWCQAYCQWNGTHHEGKHRQVPGLHIGEPGP